MNHASFEPALVRRRDGSFCHIFYRPTVAGFEADSINAPVSTLFFNIDTISFLTHRPEETGDSLDAAKRIVSHIGRPLVVSLVVSVDDHERQYEQAVRFHFGTAMNQFRFQHVALTENDPWMQDYMKSGHVGNSPRILISRRAFEGRPENGDRLQPMIDSFRQPPFVHSNLAFEGGDLTFVRNPADRRLTLFYGTSAQEYWASALNRAEFEYVLRAEFGAAKAVYAGGVTPHIDYSMKLLPKGRLALVAQPVCDDLELARAAVSLLMRSSADFQPAALFRLSEILASGAEALTRNRDEILGLTHSASASGEHWKPRVSERVQREIEGYVHQECPGNPVHCMAPEHLTELLDHHTALLKDWIRVGTRVRLKELLATRLLEVIRRQASGCDATEGARLEHTAMLLESMGYRVVRVPWVQGDGAPASPWPGVSYVNAVDVDDQLFVPEMGFGTAEDGWIEGLETQLRGLYQVTPIRAASLLLDNGGLHCAVAAARAAPTPTPIAVNRKNR